ncbi:MAG: SDR family oxidoreductase [Balneolaceae bacterium]
MQHVLIFGANGKVGRILTDKLDIDPDFTPTAVIRDKEQRAHFEDRGIKTRLGDLESSVEALTKLMNGMDAIVFTAGSGGSTGAEKTLTVDLDGALKTMEAAEAAGVRRYVMVSALNAGTREGWEDSPIRPYYVAKHVADRILTESSLNYTILRPGRLLDDLGTGMITTEDPAKSQGVAREDVAELALQSLRNDTTIRKVIEFNEGDTPIRDVVEGL